MLAWLHSKVIGDLYQRHKFEKVIIDKFANKDLISYYVKKTCAAELHIITKAEADTVVATASIIARYLYIKRLNELSEKYGIKLLKGASVKVKALRDSIDKELLPYLVKMHFK
jgi:ribonuclease HIII